MSETNTTASETVQLSPVLALLEQLFLLLKTSSSHGAYHPLSRQLATATSLQVQAVGAPFAMQFIGGVIFLDRELVPLTPATYQMTQAISRCLAHAMIHEVTFNEVPEPNQLSDFANELTRGNRPKGQAINFGHKCLDWRSIEAATYGSELEKVDPDVFASAQLALAVSAVEALMLEPDESWNFTLAVSAVRRLERTLAGGRSAILRALEIAPGTWSPARRVVAACIHLLSMATTLAVSQRTQRASAHALLAMGVCGYYQRGGKPVGDAVIAAHSRVVESNVTARGPAAEAAKSEPHRIRTCSLLTQYVRTLQKNGLTNLHPLLASMSMCYELELMRCPVDSNLDLTMTDSLARFCSSIDEPEAPAHLRALMAASGALPPGSRVRLDDGQVGIVLDAPADDPLRPVVLVQGRIMVAQNPVSLVPPLQVQGRIRP